MKNNIKGIFFYFILILINSTVFAIDSESFSNLESLYAENESELESVLCSIDVFFTSWNICYNNDIGNSVYSKTSKS